MGADSNISVLGARFGAHKPVVSRMEFFDVSGEELRRISHRPYYCRRSTKDATRECQRVTRATDPAERCHFFGNTETVGIGKGFASSFCVWRVSRDSRVCTCNRLPEIPDFVVVVVVVCAE